MTNVDFPINLKPLRKLALIFAGLLLGAGVLALLPFLMHHTSMTHRDFLASKIRIIAQEPDPFLEPFQEEIPEAPPLPPEPSIDIPPMELPEPAMSEPPEPPPLENHTPEPVALEPLQQTLSTTINTPSLTALSVKGVPVRPGTFGKGLNFAKVLVPRPAALVKKPINKIRFNLDELDKAPEKISAIQPMYPQRARRIGIEGVVSVKFLVNRFGGVKQLSITHADPPDTFNDTVMKTVGKWKFKPGRKDGRTVETWIKTNIRFKLKKG